MKKIEGIKPLGDMSVAELREAVLNFSIRRRKPADVDRMTRRQLVELAESLYVPPKPPRPRKRRPRSPKNVGIGKWCQEMLAKVVGHDTSGQPIGIGYNELVKMARRKFPKSAVDERHFRWYAAKMRREDKFIPVERPRSRWI